MPHGLGRPLQAADLLMPATGVVLPSQHNRNLKFGIG
jgi:hypothetical protein